MLDQEQDHLLKAEPEVTETVDLHQKDGKELKKKKNWIWEKEPMKHIDLKRNEIFVLEI